MTLGDLGESDLEDYVEIKDRNKTKKNQKDFNIRNQSVSVPSDQDLEGDGADTLKENDSDTIHSIDAEYDVEDDDEARLSKRIQNNVIGHRSTQRSSGTKNSSRK